MQMLNVCFRLAAGAMLTKLTAACLCLPARNSAAADSVDAPVRGIDRTGMDPGVKPGDNFFAHVNGAWVKRTQIPADRSRWGVGGVLAEEAERRTAELL